MKIEEFDDKFTVDPSKDIAPNFHLDKTIRMDAVHHKGCFCCGDMMNNKTYYSVPWTIVQRCFRCNHINVVHVQDRMSGVYEDIVECYTEKS